jgi:hypothetical protein
MDAGQADDTRLSPFVRIPREEWGRLLAATSFSPLKGVVRDLRGVSEHLPWRKQPRCTFPSRGSCTST